MVLWPHGRLCVMSLCLPCTLCHVSTHGRGSAVSKNRFVASMAHMANALILVVIVGSRMV
jgi:hypothetical protein